MRELYDAIKSDLDLKKRSFTWLSEKVGYSRQGLKTSLLNGNIKYETLVKIANELETTVSSYFHIKPETKDINDQVHYLRYQNKLGNNYQDEILKENEWLKNRITNLEKEVETYRKMVDVLYKKIDHIE
jgi:lambda repressor-like predicted transcriptional regulator